VRILYANHTGRVSGAERSLLDLLTDLPEEVSAVVACPPGKLMRAVQRVGVPVSPLPETDGSFRLHPWYSVRAIVQMGRAALRLRVEAKRLAADLIHANTIRAGLAAVLSAKLGGPPVIVHLRDCLPDCTAAKITRHFLISGASLFLANSRYTAGRFVEGTCPAQVMTVHNPVDLDRFSPSQIARAQVRKRLGIESSGPVLGVVGQLAPWKGQDDAIRCLSVLRSMWPGACLLLVGSTVFTSKATRYDNSVYAESLRRIATDLRLNGSVRFLGEREDIPEILRALDLLLVPSWEEPFGRSVIEAMATEVPVVSTSVGGPAEIITNGVDGVLLPPRQPENWAKAIDGLLNRPAWRADMGRRARCTAVGRFGVDAHVDGVLDAYRRVLGERLN
jgi:L-malate glycosyltransferase